MTIIDEFSKVSLAWIDQWVFIVMKSGFMQTKYAFDWNILFKYTWIHKCRSKKSVSISIHDSCNQEISEFSLQWKRLMYHVFLMVNYMWHVHILVNHPLYLFLRPITKQKMLYIRRCLIQEKKPECLYKLKKENIFTKMLYIRRCLTQENKPVCLYRLKK
jgi:hypothetical protein